MSATSCDVSALVVGAGPVGLTMAVELLRHGLSCRIIDKAPAPSDKSKALVVWSRTLELLHQTGTADNFLAAGMKAKGARVFGEGKELVHLNLEGIASPYPFPLMIPQSETERLLGEHLHRLGVTVERRVELIDFQASADGIAASLKHPDGREENLRTSWLLGCDGAHSTVRQLLGFEFSGEGEPNDWILADVHVQGLPAADELFIYWHHSGILAFFPIGAGRYRMIADLGTAQGSGHPPDPTLEQVQAVINARGPTNVLVSEPNWLAGFRIHERKVAEYRRGRAFLAGDAAHIHSPAGGQGMNTGMQDAFNLAWKLALVHAGRAKDSLLDSYSSERSAVGDMVLRNAGTLTRVATLRNPVSQFIRNHTASILGSFHFVQERMKNTLAELDINYRTSPLSGEQGRAARGLFGSGGVPAGNRLPDVPLRDPRAGTDVQLFDLLKGNRFALFLLPGELAPDAVKTVCEAGAHLERFYPEIIDVHLVLSAAQPPAELPWKGSILLDPERRMHEQHGVKETTLVLVRPDGYICYRSQPALLSGILEHLAKFLVAMSRQFEV